MGEQFRVITRAGLIEEFRYENEGRWREPFLFIQAADTQFGMIDEFGNKNRDHPSVEPEVGLSNRAIDAINSMTPRPKFMVICGDLVDAMPGVSFRAEQIDAFKRTFSRLHPDIKLVCTCGNHDVGNSPTVQTIDAYRAEFGDDYFSFWVGGVKFIALNSQYFLDDTHVKRYRDEQDRWLDQQLANDPSKPFKHLVGFQHVPPFINTPDEPMVPILDLDLPFNIAKLDERKRLLSKLKAARMKKLFCGHYHRNGGGWDEGLEVVVTSAIGMQLGDDKHGLRVVRVTEQNIQHDYYSLDEIPTQVAL